MQFLRKAIATTFGARQPAFGSMRFRDHGALSSWKGELRLEGQTIGLVAFAGLDGPTQRQRAEFERIQPRLPELLAVALARVAGLRKLGYGGVEELRPAAHLQHLVFQPEGSPSDWGFEMTVDERGNIDGWWVVNVQFRGDAVTHVDAHRD